MAATNFTDSSCPTIALTTHDTALPTVRALALCVPGDGRPAIIPPAPLVTTPPVLRNPLAKLEGRNKQKPAALRPGQIPMSGLAKTIQIATRPGVAPATAPGDEVFEHPDVGGRFTVFALFWGPAEFYDLHRRCLESIIATAPPGRIDLRVGSNELNAKSLALIEQYRQQGIISKHYRHPGNDLKYPVMREMFYDPTHPITTKWVIWFDDDSIADRTPHWLHFLAQSITQSHRGENAHMYGAKFFWNVTPEQRVWYQNRPWYRGKPWRQQNGKGAPNGDKIHFVAGGWWAITHEAILACDIPDRDIGHNGGDVCIGEQLYQGGFNMKLFNMRKQIVNTSSVKRRGITQPAAGTKAWQQQRK